MVTGYDTPSEPRDWDSTKAEATADEKTDKYLEMKKDKGRTKQIDRLFYSETDQKLFYIPPYYTHGTGMLDQLIKNLTEAATILRSIMGNEGEIYCDEIRTSRRYKGMWYFAIHCETAPPQAFQLGKDLEMFKWIEG